MFVDKKITDLPSVGRIIFNGNTFLQAIHVSNSQCVDLEI